MSLEEYNKLYDKYCKIDRRWRKTNDPKLKQRRDRIEKILSECELE